MEAEIEEVEELIIEEGSTETLDVADIFESAEKKSEPNPDELF